MMGLKLKKKSEYDEQKPVILDSTSYEDNDKDSLREKLRERYKLNFGL